MALHPIHAIDAFFQCVPSIGCVHRVAVSHLMMLPVRFMHASILVDTLTSCCQCVIGLQHSKQLLWGWYTLRFYPPDALIEAIAKRLTPLVHNMDARTVSEFIWAFGGLNYAPSNMQLFLQVSTAEHFVEHPAAAL